MATSQIRFDSHQGFKDDGLRNRNTIDGIIAGLIKNLINRTWTIIRTAGPKAGHLQCLWDYAKSNKYIIAEGIPERIFRRLI